MGNDMAQGIDGVIDSEHLVDERALAVAPRLTAEAAAYVAVGFLAAVLRFVQLGLRPLDAAEAQQALAAFRLVGGEIQAAPAGTLPALLTGNAATFTLLGAGDASARLLPALAGLLLALLPLGLRHRLGRGGALVASLLLALSPSAIYTSRRVDGAMLVAACGLALVVGLVRYVDFGRPRALYLAAGALGLGLAAGPGFYTWLLILVLFGVVLYVGQRWLGRDTGWSALLGAYEAARQGRVDAAESAPAPAAEEEEPPGPSLLLRVGAILAAAFGLSATTFALQPAGIGLAADLFASWARSFMPEPGGQPASYPLLLLLLCEPLILVLGLLEAGRWLAGRRATNAGQSSLPTSLSHTALFLFWALGAALLIVIAGHRPATNVLLVIVPLALLGGQGLESVWRRIEGRVRGQDVRLVTLVALGLAVFFYLQLAAFARASSSATVEVLGMTVYTTSTYLFLALVALVLAIGLGAAAWIWRGPQVVAAVAWLAAVTILSLFTVKATWRANFDPDPRDLLVGQSTAPGVGLLVGQLEELSQNRSGDVHTLEVTVDAATGPVVRWYLRDFKRLDIVDGLSQPPDTEAAVTLASSDLPLGEEFRGQGYPLRWHWLPWGLWGQDLIRWLLFGEGSLPTIDQEVVLWVSGTQS
jgi:uncharacterized protein (TIGR03663 family)